MIGTLKIGKTEFTFVFRHKWDNRDKKSYDSNFRDYRLGLWFKRNKMVGKKDFNKPKKWKNNLVNDYMIGVNLIVCKAWVSFNRGGMSIK
jgi:hypothetical protein